MKRGTEERGGLREFVRFAQATLLAMAVEMASFMLLKRVLPAGGTGMLFATGNRELRTAAAFLISSVAANALSFVLNRTRTFHSHSSLGYAVPLYVLYNALMIVLQTALGPILESGLSGMLGDGAAAAAKAMMMALSFGVSYPVNKYVIMRPSSRGHD